MSALPLTDNRGMSGHAPAGDPATGGTPKTANRFDVMALDTLALAGAYACALAVIVLLCLTRTTRPGFDSNRFCRFSNGRADIALMNEMNDKIDHARRNMLSAWKAWGSFPLYMRTDRTDPIRNPFVREDSSGIERSNTEMPTQ